MNKGLFFGSLVMAVAAAVALFMYISAPVSKSITGFVMTRGDGNSEDPVKDAKVRLTPDDSDRTLDSTFRRVVKTDPRGWFSFTDLPEGTYQIEVTTDDGLAEITKKLARGTNVVVRPRRAESRKR
jgi:uncharacterized GH25 family protein